MPHIILTLSGKEKIVRAALAEQDIDCRIPPLRGFVVCETAPPIAILCLPQVLGVVDATREEADMLVRNEVLKTIKTGMLVRVTNGKYKEYRGIVRTKGDGEATVDLSIYGHMLVVDLPLSDLEMSCLPEPWG